jgi:uncharacterized protein with FMN-binding domain
MRRSIPVLAATAGGLALLANFHTTSTTVGATGVSATAPASTPSPGGDDGDSPRQAVGGVTTTTTIKSATATSPTTAAGAATPTKSGTGSVIRTAYGPVQVRVTMRGDQLVDVQALQLPSDRSRSARISQEAGPILRTEALRAQSANIDIVSGASYTSEGYARSLQSAINAAR